MSILLQIQETCVIDGGKTTQYCASKKDRKIIFRPVFSYCPRYKFPFYEKTQNAQVLPTFSPHQRKNLNDDYLND